MDGLRCNTNSRVAFKISCNKLGGRGEGGGGMGGGGCNQELYIGRKGITPMDSHTHIIPVHKL